MTAKNLKAELVVLGGGGAGLAAALAAAEKGCKSIFVLEKSGSATGSTGSRQSHPTRLATKKKSAEEPCRFPSQFHRACAIAEAAIRRTAVGLTWSGFLRRGTPGS